VTQKRSIGFHDPRNSSEVNDRFVGVHQSGPTNGFNVRALPASTQIRIHDYDGIDTTACTLVTPEGVVIAEDVGFAFDIDLGSPAANFDIVCRYAWGVEGTVATYLALPMGTRLATDTLLAQILKGSGNVSDDEITELARIRYLGLLRPISQIYGSECVKGIQALCLGGSDNFASFPSGYNTTWLPSNRTEYGFDIFVPDHHSQTIDNPNTLRDFTLLFYLYVTATSTGTNAVFDLDLFEAAPGFAYDPTTPTLTLQTTINLSAASLNLCFEVEFASLANMTKNRIWHARVARRGDLAGDDYLGTVDLIGGVFRYARHKVGDAYLSFPP
jgi:hypothetical protein